MVTLCGLALGGSPLVHPVGAEDCTNLLLPLLTPPDLNPLDPQQNQALPSPGENTESQESCSTAKGECWEWNKSGTKPSCSKTFAVDAWSGAKNTYYCSLTHPPCIGPSASGAPTDGTITGRVTWFSTEACKINGQNACLVDQFVDGAWIESARSSGQQTELHANTAKSDLNGDGTHGFKYW